MSLRGSGGAFAAEMKIDGRVCKVALTVAPLKLELVFLRGRESDELVRDIEVVSKMSGLLKELRR